MEFDDYESLPTSNVGVHMTAGAVAGVMEHCLMFPVDSVKTRMQSLAPSPEATYKTIREGLTKMVASEGLMRPVWGVNAVILGAGPAHALYFSAYEGIKKKLKSSNPYRTHLANAVAGCGATVLHDAIMVPADLIKQRMQMYNSPYSSCFDCMKKVYSCEGMLGFYRSYTTQMAMNLPFHAVHIVMYEKIQHIFNPEHEYNPKVHMFAGALAGAVAAASTTPLDMCKTLLNTQEATTLTQLQKSKITGIMGALRSIYAMQGIPGFFRGIKARVLYQMPGTAISWSIYELFKHHMLKSGGDNPSSQWDSDLIKDSVLLEDLSDATSKALHDDKSNFTEKRYTIGTTTTKTVERFRHLQMPASLTASCAAVEDSYFGK